MADPVFTVGGLATGMDTQSMIDKLVSLESRPLTLLQKHQSAFKSQVSTLGDISSKLAELQTAAKSLGANGALGLKTTSTNTAFSATPGTSAVAGSYDIQVQHLATPTKLRSDAFQSGDTVSIKLYARNACVGSGKNSGRARLWFNDSAANSRFDGTIGDPRTYFLRDAFVLATTPGPGPKRTIDVGAGAKCSPYKTFGTWSTTVP